MCRTTIEMSGLSKVEMSSFTEVKEGMNVERRTDSHESVGTGCVAGDGAGVGAHGDTPDVAALIAPRPLHMNFGEKDAGSPIDEVRRGVETIRDAYVRKGAESHFSHYIEEGAGHVLSDEMWRRTREFFARHLQGRA